MTEEKQEKKKTKVEEAAETVARLEKLNAELKEQLDRKEQLMAETVLSGSADKVEKETPKEETPEEYKDRVMSGNV